MDEGKEDSQRRRARAAIAFALLLLVGAAAALTSTGAEGTPARPAPELGDWRTLVDTVAGSWPARQRADGSFPDYMAARGAGARDLYGEAMLGYGLLKVGVQRGDERAISSGLRGLGRAVAHPRPFHSIVFEKLALAAGYNLAREHLAQRPEFIAGRARWEARLREMKPTWLGRGRGHYFNQHLVDAVTVIELARSGLRSGGRGTVSRDPGGALRLAERLVNRDLPAALGSHTTRTRAGSMTLASDGALAYHALTLGFYARAVKLLGRRASPRAHALLGSLARASWALAAPDGDVAYFGRSQGQAWALALTSYGAEVASDSATPIWAARHRAISRRTLGRLRAVHAGGPFGLHLTPGFRNDASAAVQAQEDYVSGTAYSGLTLLGLGWTGDRLALTRRPAGRLAADSHGAALLDRGARRFAVVSTGRLWYVVRLRPARPGELGSGAGLAALKVADRQGAWRDPLPHGVVGRPTDSTGPLLELRHGGAATARGRALRLRRGSSVTLFADLVTSSGRPVRRAAIAFRPGRCAVRIAPQARRGERWEYSAFLPASPRPSRLGRRAVAGREVRTGYRGAGHIVTGGRYISPSYGALVRSRTSVRAAPAVFTLGLGRGCAAG